MGLYDGQRSITVVYRARWLINDIVKLLHAHHVIDESAAKEHALELLANMVGLRGRVSEDYVNVLQLDVFYNSLETFSTDYANIMNLFLEDIIGFKVIVSLSGDKVIFTGVPERQFYENPNKGLPLTH